MGCDIHMCIEENRGSREEPRWEPLLFSGAAWSQRNYRLFSWLADVRNGEKGTPRYVEPLSCCREYPKDCATEVRKHLSERADHSQTWLLASEILDVPVIPDFAEHFVLWLTHFLCDQYTWLGMCSIPEEGTFGTPPDRIRLVFGFDN